MLFLCILWGEVLEWESAPIVVGRLQERRTGPANGVVIPFCPGFTKKYLRPLVS
jgi:hypothetical protein